LKPGFYNLSGQALLAVTRLLLFFIATGAYAISVQVVDDAGNPIVGAGIYLSSTENNSTASPDTPQIDVLQLDKRFTPAVTIVPLGSQVTFINTDDITHHIYTVSGQNQFSLMLRRGKQSEPISFDATGILALGCNIHDWMGGYLLVAKADYWGNTDNSGNWSVNTENGQFELVVWHPEMTEAWSRQINLPLEDTQKIVLPYGFNASEGQKALSDFDFLEGY